MKNKARGWQVITEWLAAHDRQPFVFQEEAWEHYIQGRSGLVTAPTGYAKHSLLFWG